MKEINLVTYNHRNAKGIEDIKVIIDSAFGNYGVEENKYFKPNKINLIIDEFSSPESRAAILDFKKRHPEARIYLISTEFFTKRWLFPTFNGFYGFWETVVCSFFSHYYRRNVDDVRGNGLLSWLRFCLYFPFLILYILVILPFYFVLFRKGALKRLKSKFRVKFYMVARFEGLLSVINCFDAEISLHPSMGKIPSSLFGKKKRLGMLYPVLSIPKIRPLCFNKKPIFSYSGTDTFYRRHWAHKINFWIEMLGVEYRWGKVRYDGFKEGNKSSSESAFTIHTQQSIGWKYSSPTRIYRAIEVNNSVPVITRKFRQHPIEEVAYYLRSVSDITKLIKIYDGELPDFRLGKAKLYNEKAREENSKLVKLVLGTQK